MFIPVDKPDVISCPFNGGNCRGARCAGWRVESGRAWCGPAGRPPDAAPSSEAVIVHEAAARPIMNVHRETSQAHAPRKRR